MLAMIEAFKRWLRSFSEQEKEESLADRAFWEQEMQRQIKQREAAEEVVGSNPLQQIDFICEHGFAKFNDIVYNQKEETEQSEEKTNLEDVSKVNISSEVGSEPEEWALTMDDEGNLEFNRILQKHRVRLSVHANARHEVPEESIDYQALYGGKKKPAHAMVEWSYASGKLQDTGTRIEEIRHRLHEIKTEQEQLKKAAQELDERISRAYARAVMVREKVNKIKF